MKAKKAKKATGNKQAAGYPDLGSRKPYKQEQSIETDEIANSTV